MWEPCWMFPSLLLLVVCVNMYYISGLQARFCTRPLALGCQGFTFHSSSPEGGPGEEETVVRVWWLGVGPKGLVLLALPSWAILGPLDMWASAEDSPCALENRWAVPPSCSSPHLLSQKGSWQGWFVTPTGNAEESPFSHVMACGTHVISHACLGPT